MNELWEELYAAEVGVLALRNEKAQARLEAARKAIAERFKNEGMLAAYRDSRELIHDWDAGSVDSAIMRLTKKLGSE